ncbi:hypothetical protein [Bacillus ndiopicus]|uniref:hypothetical protein n=1 Tax=Bacillus ndiopicus TaxID=1347368 RepID=UPI0005A60874|nr:hypothetical protein [Bacillus ndiopicus]
MEEEIVVEEINPNNDFVNKLIEMTRKKDNQLKGFIDKKLINSDTETINKHIDKLKTMDENQQLIVKARAKQFEETNDPSKGFPILLAIIGIILSAYALLREFTNNHASIIFLSMLVVAIFAGSTTLYLNNVMKQRSTAIYFNYLVTNIKYENEKIEK